MNLDSKSKSEPKVTLHTKLHAIKDTVAFSVVFLRTFCEFTLHHDNWKEILSPLAPTLEEFIEKREGNSESFNDLVQLGGLYIMTLEQFFRSDFVKENAPLTEAEKTEIKQEILEAFNDPKASQEIRKAAAVVGWKLITIMDQFVDHEKVKKQVEAKLESITLNFQGLALSDNIIKTAAVVDKAYLLSETLSGKMGIHIGTDNVPYASNPEEEERLRKFLAEKDTSLFKEDDDSAALDELKILTTPLGTLSVPI